MNVQHRPLTQMGLLVAAVAVLAGCSATSEAPLGTAVSESAPAVEPSATSTMTGDASPTASTGDPSADATPDSTADSTGRPSADASAGATSSSSPAAAGGAAGAAIPLVNGGEHTITAPGPVTVECSGGGDIKIESDDVELTFTGACEDIEVDGNNNTMSGGEADQLDLEGDGNTVTAASVDEIVVEGDANTLDVDETRDIELKGDSNTMTYRSGDPVVETEGNNSVSVG